MSVSYFAFFLILSLTFLLTECCAWLLHKYVMHGILWYLHADHHVKEPGFFERNDSFLLVFAIPSWLCIMLGSIYGHHAIVAIGFGILCYGFAYFFVHDVIIHRRFKFMNVPDNFYVQAIRKAHRTHHTHLGKNEGECFGLLIVPFKYYTEAWQAKKAAYVSTEKNHY